MALSSTERTRRFRRKNAEAVRAYRRQHYLNHREQILASQRRRYHARREEGTHGASHVEQ